MTRGEAPGGSRPGAFGAIRLRRMDGGIATAPLGGSAHPHPHGLTGGAQQKPVGNRQRHSWGWLAVSTGERRRKLRLSYFLSPAQKRVSALLGRPFLHYPPIWMGVIMWL